jgi:hypothetical protein
MRDRGEVECLECGYRGWADVVVEGQQARAEGLPLEAWCVHRSAAYVRVVTTGQRAVVASGLSSSS